jgi:hypothetical protein
VGGRGGRGGGVEAGVQQWAEAIWVKRCGAERSKTSSMLWDDEKDAPAPGAVPSI